MINVIKNNLKLLEKINTASKKRAATFADIQYLKGEIKEFESKWVDFQKFISTLGEVDSCDVEQLDSIHSKSWDIWSDLDSLIYQIQELIRTIWKNYIPPCPEAVLEYKMGARNTPLYLAKLEEELEPLNNLKVKQEFFKHQEIYSFIHLSDGFLVNFKHMGVKFLNNDLSLKKEISFLEKDYEYVNFSFWNTYKKFNSNEIIFANTGEEDPSILYINIDKEAYLVIPKKQLKDISPSRVYYWSGEELVLFRDDIFYGVNPYTKKVRTISSNEIKKELPDFYNYVEESLNYYVLRAYPEQNVFIYRDVENLEIGIRNTKENTAQIIKFYNEEVYDVKIHSDYIMFIEESRIDVRKGKHKRTLILPDPGHFFIGAEFFERDGKLYVAALDETNTLGVSSSVAFYEIADSFKKMVADDPWK